MLMGLHHGLYCLGCCWALMALLFAGGTMNLYWIVGLALVVALEKMCRHGDLLAQCLGVALVGLGVFVMVGIF